MGRLPRPTGDDLIHHAINRGNNRADVLGPDGERDMFPPRISPTDTGFPRRQVGVSSSLLLPLHQVSMLDSWEDFRKTIRYQFIIIASLASSQQVGFMGRLPRPTGDDLIHHAINRGNNRADVLGPDGERDMFPPRISPTDTGFPRRQVGVSSSLLLPLHQVSMLDSWEDFRKTIRYQFIIIASLASSQQVGFMGRLPRPTGDDLIHHAINRGNNRADVLGPDGERDMFPPRISPTDTGFPRRQVGVSSSLLLPLHQVSMLDSWEDFRKTIRYQFIIIASLASSQQVGFMGRLPRPTGDDLIHHAINRGN